MRVKVDYPDSQSEQHILRLVRNEITDTENIPPFQKLTGPVICSTKAVMNLHISEPVETYLIQLVMATRQPSAYCEELANWIEFGVSPRATIALDRCARAHAFLAGKDHVTPDDVRSRCF